MAILTVSEVLATIPAAVLTDRGTLIWKVKEHIWRPPEVLLTMRKVTVFPFMFDANLAEGRLIAVEHKLLKSESLIEIVNV